MFIKNNENIINILKEYGFNIIYKLKDVKTTKNISYFNFKAKKINEYVHNNLIDIPNDNIEYKNTKYFNNLYISCKKHHRISFKLTNKYNLNPNFEYSINEYKKGESKGEKTIRSIIINNKQDVFTFWTLEHHSLQHTDDTWSACLSKLPLQLPLWVPWKGGSLAFSH